MLFADADAERFVCRLIERGQERGCLRRLAWKAIREPMRDAKVVRAPTSALGPYIAEHTARFIVFWDHHGSGCEQEDPTAVEESVIDLLERAGIDRSRSLAIALVPELEAVLIPVWPRVLEELAKVRGQNAPKVHMDESDPKSSLSDALRRCQLRASPPVFADLAGVLSLRDLKNGAALGRLAQALVDWFGS